MTNHKKIDFNFECRRCGKCCDFFILGFNIGISKNDLHRWRLKGRKDILSLFKISDDWFGDIKIYPTLLSHNRCPFLIKNEDFYECKIHNLKPEGCRSFPFYTNGTIHPWAEKYCLGLKLKKENHRASY